VIILDTQNSTLDRGQEDREHPSDDDSQRPTEPATGLSTALSTVVGFGSRLSQH